jgi:hypothetical protein
VTLMAIVETRVVPRHVEPPVPDVDTIVPNMCSMLSRCALLAVDTARRSEMDPSAPTPGPHP